LIKIEEVIDQLILSFIEKMKHATPHFLFSSVDWIKHSPTLLKEKIAHHKPGMKLRLQKFIGFFLHYITMLSGQFVAGFIYLKSDAFKKRNKFELATAPIRKFKTEPVKAFSILFATATVSYASYMIFVNTQKIISGTKALRAPASVHVEQEPILEFKKLKYEVLDKEIFLDVTLVATSLEEVDKLTPIEKDIEELLLGIHINAAQLPLSEEEMNVLKQDIMAKLVGSKIKTVEIKQVLEARPKYFLQTEKLLKLKDIDLQLFLEDTKRNRQVYIDFTALATNRNAVLFLKDHDVEVRDYLNMNVEPVIPQLPIEEEGRQIIKDKVRDELNQFLKNNGVEGKILEIYVDYLMVS
jgi:flagellar basal body-associated protein FliL